MNLVVFTSDAKATSSLNSIMFEAYNVGFNLFAVITESTQLSHPISHKSKFNVLSNCGDKKEVYSESLGLALPFNPDWLIVNRERWNPETQIIQEFKQKFNSKVGLVEPNASMINAYEGILEASSKNRFVPLIDVFFDHSSFISEQRKKKGFVGNLVVVGNPKYDINLEVKEEQLNELKNKYNVDEDKEQVLLFSLVNGSRDRLFVEFNRIVKQNPDKQYFIKPYPGEPFEDKFRNQYFPKFFIDEITPILEETDVWGMFHICDTHIGAFSSIFHSSLLLGKQIYDLSNEIGMREMFTDPNHILNPSGGGVENNIDMWLRTFNLDNKLELEQMLFSDKFDNAFENNKKIWNLVDNSLYYGNNTKDYTELLNKFDDFNDGQSAKRIVKYIGENV